MYALHIKAEVSLGFAAGGMLGHLCEDSALTFHPSVCQDCEAAHRGSLPPNSSLVCTQTVHVGDEEKDATSSSSQVGLKRKFGLQVPIPACDTGLKQIFNLSENLCLPKNVFLLLIADVNPQISHPYLQTTNSYIRMINCAWICKPDWLMACYVFLTQQSGSYGSQFLPFKNGNKNLALLRLLFLVHIKSNFEIKGQNFEIKVEILKEKKSSFLDNHIIIWRV